MVFESISILLINYGAYKNTNKKLKHINILIKKS